MVMLPHMCLPWLWRFWVTFSCSSILPPNTTAVSSGRFWRSFQCQPHRVISTGLPLLALQFSWLLYSDGAMSQAFFFIKLILFLWPNCLWALVGGTPVHPLWCSCFPTLGSRAWQPQHFLPQKILCFLSKLIQLLIRDWLCMPAGLRTCNLA